MGNCRWPSAVALCGACGSLGATLWMGWNTPRPLLVLFLGWVFSPFAALLVAGGWSSRWTRPTPAFLMVPLASWLVIAIDVGRAAWTARKR